MERPSLSNPPVWKKLDPEVLNPMINATVVEEEVTGQNTFINSNSDFLHEKI